MGIHGVNCVIYAMLLAWRDSVYTNGVISAGTMWGKKGRMSQLSDAT